ncbi:MAG: BamA/TamA family outer membrane protein, partial [Candidatus Accumulibacter sp.]|nr:BamA/TamA family outer membrane protein [Accumulibacter sp.]
TVCDEGPIRMSVGIAATWLSPLGPLKFSLAHPLNKQKNDSIQRFQFQMGTIF